MAVTIHKGGPQPPSKGPIEHPVPGAPDKMIVVDARGRAIKVRQLKAIDRMRLFGFIDNSMADKDRWLSYAFLASCCAAIDGDPVMLPSGTKEIEFLVQRLDDEGLNAIATKLTEIAGETAGAGDEAAKKSAATQA